jgi:uncharacterized protein (DUF433 family)
MPVRNDIYGGNDPVNLAAYSAAEAAAYLGTPVTTVRAWVFGQAYRAEKGPRRFVPVIEPADREERLLSFRNLVELHVLNAVRRQHLVRLQAVRKALDFLRDKFKSDHPLADEEMLTDGTSLFVTKYGQLINASKEGQLALAEALQDHLKRIERDPKGVVRRFYPFTNRYPDDRRIVAIDPRVEFGKPCLVGTGIPTVVLAERFKAGDSVQSLASDYRRPQSEIEDAIRYQVELKAA